MGSLSSLMLSSIILLLLFNYISTSVVNVIDFKSRREEVSEIPHTSYYGIRPILLTDLIVVKETGTHLVKQISFNATYMAEGGVRATAIPHSNLIIAYMKRVGGNPARPTLVPTVKRIPYSPNNPASTGWFVKAVYNDLLDPLDVTLESGAWNSGETIEIVVQFALADQPYYNPTRGLGYLYILLDLPTGECGVMGVK